jgi:hypothetical protein
MKSMPDQFTTKIDGVTYSSLYLPATKAMVVWPMLVPITEASSKATAESLRGIDTKDEEAVAKTLVKHMALKHMDLMASLGAKPKRAMRLAKLFAEYSFVETTDSEGKPLQIQLSTILDTHFKGKHLGLLSWLCWVINGNFSGFFESSSK